MDAIETIVRNPTSFISLVRYIRDLELEMELIRNDLKYGYDSRDTQITRLWEIEDEANAAGKYCQDHGFDEEWNDIGSILAIKWPDGVPHKENASPELVERISRRNNV